MRCIPLLFLLILAACSGNSEVSSKLSGTDSLVINFYEPGTTQIVQTVATAEASAIRRLTEFVSARETEIFKCGYDGNLLFFERGKQISDVSFKFSDEACRHFLMDVKGKLVATTMSSAAADFLFDLKARN